MTPLTDAEIAEMERLEREATAGPWEAIPWRYDADGESHAPEVIETDKTVVFSVCYDHAMRTEEANTKLVAALRNAAPQLLASAREANRLRTALVALRELPDSWPMCMDREGQDGYDPFPHDESRCPRCTEERAYKQRCTDVLAQVDAALSATAPEDAGGGGGE